MTPPILLDLSRLLSRARSPTPTGIDRIELAYAEHLSTRAGDRLSFVAMNLAGEIAPLRARYGRLLVETLSMRWRSPDGAGKAARRLGPLARFAALAPPGRSLLPAAGCGDSQRPVYLLISHQNLQYRERFARFKAQSGAAFVFFVHDLIPIDYPEYSRPGQAKRHRRRIETICALADGVVVNSEATAASLVPCLARAGRNVPVLVAHPGVEFASAAPPDYYGARLLCPSFVEGYGLPIAEALALGVPVICSDIPAFREVGRGAPEFLDPLDGPGWLRAIRDYAAPASPRRAAQLARLPRWRPARWDEHIDSVAALLNQVSPAAPLQDPVPRGVYGERGPARPAARHRTAQPC